MRLEKLFVVSAAVGIALMAGACAQRYVDLWQNPHRAEGEGFGDNHRQLMAKHIVNPDPANPTDMDSAVEAQRLNKGMDDYMKGDSGGLGGGKGGTSVKSTVK